MKRIIKEYIQSWVDFIKWLLFVAVVALILWGTFWANVWFIQWAAKGG